MHMLGRFKNLILKNNFISSVRFICSGKIFILGGRHNEYENWNYFQDCQIWYKKIIDMAFFGTIRKVKTNAYLLRDCCVWLTCNKIFYINEMQHSIKSVIQFLQLWIYALKRTFLKARMSKLLCKRWTRALYCKSFC